MRARLFHSYCLRVLLSCRLLIVSGSGWADVDVVWCRLLLLIALQQFSRRKSLSLFTIYDDDDGLKHLFLFSFEPISQMWKEVWFLNCVVSNKVFLQVEFTLIKTDGTVSLISNLEVLVWWTDWLSRFARTNEERNVAPIFNLKIDLTQKSKRDFW